MKQTRHSTSRRTVLGRTVLGGLGAALAGPAVLRSQQDPFRDHSRVPGMDELVTVSDFEPVAFAKLPREAWTYTAYGSEGEFTLRRNREAFDWVELVPRGIVDVSAVQTSLDLWASKWRSRFSYRPPRPTPLCIASRSRYAPGSHGGLRHAHDRQRQRDAPHGQDRSGGHQPAVVSALPAPGPRRHPRIRSTPPRPPDRKP